MVVIDKGGYFEEGVWYKGLYPPHFIGKKIIRELPVRYETGHLDYSHSLRGKYEFPRLDEWMILRGLNLDGSMLLEWGDGCGDIIKGKINLYEPEWNDGNWITLEEAIQKYGGMVRVVSNNIDLRDYDPMDFDPWMEDDMIECDGKTVTVVKCRHCPYVGERFTDEEGNLIELYCKRDEILNGE